MQDIQSVLRTAAIRLGFINALRGTCAAVTVALALAILARVSQQLLGLVLPWREIAIWSPVACLLAGVVYAIVARPSQRAVARRVDEGGNLRESISTALCVVGHDDAWSRATIDSASATARRVRVSTAVPISAPRFWPVPLALSLALAVLIVALPKIDLTGWNKKVLAEKEQERAVIEVKQQIEVGREKLEQMTKNLDLTDEDDNPGEGDKPESKDPEAVRKSAISKLTKLSDKMQELRQGAEAAKLEAVKEKLSQVSAPGKELAELTKSLAAGNFSQAKSELEKLGDQIASAEQSSMSPEQKEELASQLNKLAEQIGKVAEDKKALEKLLTEAGIEKALAQNPEALKKALEAAQNLSQEQKQELLKQAQAQENAAEALKGLSEALQKCSSECKGGEKSGGKQGQQGQQPGEQPGAQPGEQGNQSGTEGMQAGMEQLSELEQISMELAEADAVMAEASSQIAQLGGQCENPGGMGECKDGMGGEGTSPWSPGWRDAMGGGSGGPGQGKGGSPGESATDFDLEKKKALGQVGDGPIVGSRMVEGESIKNESRAAFSERVVAAEQNASETFDGGGAIPREYHDAIKTYFGRLKARTEAGSGGTPASKSDQKPAEKASDKP